MTYKTVTVTPLITLRIGTPPNSQLVPPNKPCEVDIDVANDLRRRGFLKSNPVENSCDQTQSSDCDEPEMEACSSSDRIDAIVDTIDDLLDDDFGKDKKPNVRAIEKILGESITAGERDEAWDKYQSLLSA